ncbi:pancreatic secretory granule membrane major glycoprotein GP2-like [Alosa sapidissima]|uniref:pancreatic secretory granule membrane major glycoprotein GP2-like n=1 Tax=Alosa sapidissima TaxID=34773 RepID=UPI001C093018|nr:pancreatic secretory granule membrane major glycoprotein GP2-like [Alosa sapidissima]
MSFSMGGLLLLLLVVLDTPQAEADPCANYIVLDTSWRATTNLDRSVVRCDSQLTNISWQGWYRMVHKTVSIRMPETCVPPYRCGTNGPLWLNGAHPRPKDGIVAREVCGSWDNNCCHSRVPSIRVKACPGNYIVYKLAKPPYCFGYCAETRTYFQQRLKLKMVLQREPSPAEIAQFSLQIREKMIQMGYPNDTTVKMV